MRVLDLHHEQLDKQIQKLKSGKYDLKRNTRRPVFFRSDSKGRSLLPYINHYNRINLVFRGGAKITADFLQNYTLNSISRVPNPVVILWFGSCELTIKRGKFVYLADNLDEVLNEIKRNYITYKDKLLITNPTSKVIFLECPYQSLIMWNFAKGHPSPGIFSENQKTLELYITKLNVIIREINGRQVVPHLAQDFQYSVKKKRRVSRYLKNYGLLYDGVHPGKKLSQLWFLRIMRMLSFV